MFRKIFIGMVGFLTICAIAGSGYQFGKYLAPREHAQPAPAAK